MTEVDLMDLISWLSFGPVDGRVEGGFAFGAKATS